VTGGVLFVTGKEPVALSAYLRHLPASFGVDRRDRRFLGRETKLSVFLLVPPVPTVVPPPLSLLAPCRFVAQSGGEVNLRGVALEPLRRRLA
jgi:hypothetical protein